MLSSTTFAQLPVKGNNLIKGYFEMEDSALLKTVVKEMMEQGWSIKDSDNELHYANTYSRQMKKYNTQMALMISINRNCLSIRGVWNNETYSQILSTSNTRVVWAKSTGNINYEMWQMMDNLVKSLKPISVEYLTE